MVLAFGTAMLRPPTRHEGWAVERTLPRAEDLADVTRQLLFAITASAPSKAIPYVLVDRAMDSIARIKAELDMYSEVSAGWDGPNSAAPQRSHIEDAKRFVSLLPAGLPLPKPMLSASGEVGLFWRSDEMFADVVMEGEHKVSMFVRGGQSGSQEEFLDDIDIDEQAGEKLVRAIESAQGEAWRH